MTSRGKHVLCLAVRSVGLVLIVFAVLHALSLDETLNAMAFLNVSGVRMCGHAQRAVGGVTEVVSHTVASLAANASWRKTPP